MEDKKLSYVLLGSALILSGLWLWDKSKKNNSYIKGGIVKGGTILTNDATKNNMPYSIDVSKIIGKIPNLSYNGYWVTKYDDGYYLDNGMVGDSPNPQYVYDLKTGAFIKILQPTYIQNQDITYQNGDYTQPM
jgi:hypothetical protein